MEVDTPQPEGNQETFFDFLDENEEIKAALGDYWKIKNGSTFLYAVISNESPLKAQFFAPTKTVKGNFYLLNETSFDVCEEDLDEKIKPPEVVSKGRNRKFYVFEQN